ncbi:MAG: DUF480 domain-containing protein [Gammaproteobacteria bacterium]|nr:DUF480 domain-containing protein [Gammaproteobacteria bacterium]
MLPELTDVEARVIACLMEKSVITPDQYPMTLNALTNACNQKSSRDPVMSLSQGEVQRTLRVLEAKHLVRVEENFKSRVEKYTQRFCNSQFSELQFDPGEFAIVCLLLLRGPQTPGELRTRSGRLHRFEDNGEVVDAVAGLLDREGDAVLVQLPRAPGRKDAEYMHLFCGAVDAAAYAEKADRHGGSDAGGKTSFAKLEERVRQLERDVADLKEKLG